LSVCVCLTCRLQIHFLRLARVLLRGAYRFGSACLIVLRTGGHSIYVSRVVLRCLRAVFVLSLAEMCRVAVPNVHVLWFGLGWIFSLCALSCCSVFASSLCRTIALDITSEPETPVKLAIGPCLVGKCTPHVSVLIRIADVANTSARR
jgi:hypothetical protein